MSPTRLRFGVFELDVRAGELRRGGSLVNLTGQPVALLGLLASRAGQVVTREEIQAAVWGPGVNVDFDQGINACIRQIRGALGDSAESPRWVQTLPRRGYRFLAPVEPVGDAVTEVPAAPPVAVGRRRGGLALAAAAAMALAGTAWVLGDRAPATPPTPMLVVLPFENLTPDRTGDVLADGLTEELIAELTRRYGGHVDVIARTSAMAYKGRALDVAQLARELGATHALEGSVRRDGTLVRVTAQLVRTSDRAHLWAGSYDRTTPELIALQTDVADAIARALGLTLLPASAREAGRSADPAASAAYLEGRGLLAQQPPDAAGARRALERAVRQDPAFALAWTALARARLLSGERNGAAEARGALQHALALDDGLAEAHLVRANLHLYVDWDVAAAGREFARALELEPGNAEAHHDAAAWWSVQGRHDEALASVARAVRLDPRSPAVLGDIGWYAYFARRFDEAVAGSRRALEVSPRDLWARRCLLLVSHLRGEHEQVVAMARTMASDPVPHAASLRAALEAARPGEEAEAFWRWDLERKRALADQGAPMRTDEAATAMVLGDRARALAALEAAVEARRGWILPFLGVDPIFDPLRNEPRFRALLERIGVPPPQ